MRIPKVYKMLVKNDIPKQKSSSLVRIRQNFYNVSDFKRTFLKRVGF